MKYAHGWAILMVGAFTTFGVAQKEVCVGAIGGSDALTWNIQQPLLKAIETEANSRGVQITTRLLTNNNDKAAKGEMAALKCDAAVLTYVSREWPSAKVRRRRWWWRDAQRWRRWQRRQSPSAFDRALRIHAGG